MKRTPLAAITTLAAFITTLALAGPAQAALSGDAVYIETDDIVLTESTGPTTFTGSGTAHLDGGTVQVGVGGQLVKNSSAPGCRAMRAIFTYAGGSTSTVTSPRICLELGTYRLSVNLRSDDSRQVVRYAAQLLTATDSTSPLSVRSGTTQYVGDAPDSYGNESRLDHDVHKAVMTKSGRTDVMFAGASDYFLQRHEVSAADFVWWTARARVTGTLTWSDMIAGTEAYLALTWTYADGSTDTVISERVTRDKLPSREITLTSSSTKAVASVSMVVGTNYAGLGGTSSGTAGRFGDGSTGQ